MNEPLIYLEIADCIASITINRPDQLNAVDELTRRELLGSLSRVAADAAVRAVILTGKGRAFCVGQDLSAVAELEDCEDCVRRTYNPIAALLADFPKPVIAAVNGPAVGAGMGLALGCDMLLMAESSFLSCAFGKVGLVPDSGVTFHLARAVGHQRAFEIASSGRRIAPEEAVNLGLAIRHVSDAELLQHAREIAITLAKEPAKAMLLTKRLLRQAQGGTLADALAAEALAQGVLGGTDDHKSLRTAFLEKPKKKATQ